MKKLVLLLCMLICVLTAQAEECYDYRMDTRGYCHKVAELNADGGVLQAQSRAEQDSGLVLFHLADGTVPLEEAAFRTECVVYGPGGFAVLTCDDPAGAVEWLRAQENVRCAELDTNVRACSAYAEEITYQSWAVPAMGMDVYRTYAQQAGSGSATVAVIDSGVFRHSLISPKLRSGGFDYVDNDDDPTNDLNGHGTRVAGIVADCARDLPVYILPIRVLDADASGKLSNVVSAVLEAVSSGADVINLSLSTFAQSEMLEEAIRSAVASGVTVVVAAGNYSCDASEVTPACMQDMGVIVVGSVEQDGTRSGFSNYGASVDVYAYGRGIVSCSRSGGYVADTGTSMAAPHVAALSAMIDLTNPSLSPEGVEMWIRRAAAGSLRIPAAGAMVPQQLGFRFSSVSLQVGDQWTLPVTALPATSLAAIRYDSDASGIVSAQDGVLTAQTVGTAQITVTCPGLENVVFTVTVNEGGERLLLLPEDLLVIGEEAFFGLNAHRVIIPQGTQTVEARAFDGGSIGFVSVPESVAEIGDNTFSGAVVVCAAESAAHAYAAENGLQYLLYTHE